MTSDRVFVAESGYRNRNERWREDGLPNIDWHLVGVWTDPEVAKAAVLASCGSGRSRWFRQRWLDTPTRYLGIHKWRRVDPSFHFHRVTPCRVDPYSADTYGDLPEPAHG